MKREDKAEIIEELVEKFSKFDYFYITDSSACTVDEINKFRKFCFAKDLSYNVFKNTLIAKALEKVNKADYAEFNTKVLKGSSGIIFSTSGKQPALVLDEFKRTTNIEKIKFKGASIDTAFYIGEPSFDDLKNLKSKQQLIGEIIGLLQSPAKTVLSSLLSGERKLAGLVKAIGEKKEKS
ncbi:MAG: 50S ribosomal protein L10 [Cytophagales bacterium]|nr:50S ribosomal protein L10 [Cytophagales bacterium]